MQGSTLARRPERIWIYGSATDVHLIACGLTAISYATYRLALMLSSLWIVSILSFYNKGEIILIVHSCIYIHIYGTTLHLLCFSPEFSSLVVTFHANTRDFSVCISGPRFALSWRAEGPKFRILLSPLVDRPCRGGLSLPGHIGHVRKIEK